MSTSEAEVLAAAEAVMNDEFNAGVPAEAPQDPVEPSAAPVEPDTPELLIDDRGRARDAETGRYVSLAGDEPTEEEIEAAAEVDLEAEPGAEAEAPDETPEEEPETEDDDEDVVELEVDDPEILAFLDKYDGDVVKALKAATEAQSLIGRMGNEKGELKQENEALQAIVQQLGLLEARITPYRNDIDEDPEALVGEVLERAMSTGYFDEATYDRAIQAWADEDQFAAARLDAQVAMARQMADQAVVSQPQPQAGDLAAEVEAFKQRHPDFETMLPSINEIAGQRPLLQRALYEGSAQERVQALEDLYALAKSRTIESDTSAAAKKVILRAKAEADQAKADAQVVGASRTSAAKQEPTGDALLQQALRELSGLDDLEIIESK